MCYENGLKSKGIDFPIAFGPIGYTGVAATEHIKPNSVFLAVPNKLLITVDKAK